MDRTESVNGRTASDGEPKEPSGDISFADTSGGFEISYSDRLANDYPELVDQSTDWLENEMGVVNLGEIDYKILMADGVLTDRIRDGLVAWWRERVEDLDLG